MNEVGKFRAETYRLQGFALMTPFAKVFLNLQQYIRASLGKEDVVYMAVAIMFFITGYFLIIEAGNIMKKGGKNES